MTFQKLFTTVFIILSYFVSYAQTGNTSTGTNAGISITTGDYNAFFGYSAGRSTTSGSYNSAQGAYAAYSITSGRANTVQGNYAGYKTTSALSNTFIGYRTGRETTTGGYNTMLGSYTGYKNITGDRNTYLGMGAGYGNTSGARNVMIGYYAGRNNLTGGYNVFLGNEAGYYETSSNKLYIENSRGSTPLIYGDFSANQVGINTKVVGSHTLSVCGSIRATEVVVESGWCDYVFYDDYELPTLEEEAQHIDNKGFLSGFESAEEMKEEITLGDVTKRQQEKIEQMMLHLIEMNERLAVLEAENTALKAEK